MDAAKCAETVITSEGNAAAENREDKLEAYEIDEVEVPDCGSEDIDFEHCRIKSINHLNRFPNVKRLCLRNNLIKCLENFTPVASTLHELDLYDNQITKIENLDSLVHLTVLDLSFNRIKHIENLDALVCLRKLFLVHNRISKI
ncbi:protein phosphatase 1 regulatory subunit 7, partial [Paragonimus westermani]